MSTGTLCNCSNPECRKYGCIVFRQKLDGTQEGIVSALLVHCLRTLTNEQRVLLAHELLKRSSTDYKGEYA